MYNIKRVAYDKPLVSVLMWPSFILSSYFYFHTVVLLLLLKYSIWILPSLMHNTRTQAAKRNSAIITLFTPFLHVKMSSVKTKKRGKRERMTLSLSPERHFERNKTIHLTFFWQSWTCYEPIKRTYTSPSISGVPVRASPLEDRNITVHAHFTFFRNCGGGL